MDTNTGVNDTIWSAVHPLFPKTGPQDQSGQRLFFEAVVYILKNGCGWRSLPKEFGKWNSVFVRYNRYCKSGVWEHIFKALSPSAITELQIDSTIVKAHRHASGAPKKRGLSRWEKAVAD